MQSIEIIAVFSIIAFVAAEEMAHGKVVVCSVPTNKMIVVSDLAFDLNINHIDWNLCTHVIVIDNYFLEVDGNIIIEVIKSIFHLKNHVN